MRVVGVDGRAGSSLLVRISISRLHKITFVFFFKNHYYGKALAGGGPCPSRHQDPCRKAVMLSEGDAVHVCSNQSVGVECLLDGNTADKWRHITGNFVETAKHHVLAGSLNASSLAHLGKTRTADTS